MARPHPRARIVTTQVGGDAGVLLGKETKELMKTVAGKDDCGVVEWVVSSAPVEYPFAVQTMEARADAIAAGRAAEMIWLLEHPSVYTAGTSAKAADLIDPERFPVFKTGRGGSTPITVRGSGLPMSSST